GRGGGVGGSLGRAGRPGGKVVWGGGRAPPADRRRGAGAADAGGRRRGAVRGLLPAVRELSCDRGALAAELPRGSTGARRGEREALRAPHLRAARAVASHAGRARQDADAAAVRLTPRRRLRPGGGGCGTRAHRRRPRARRERRRAAPGNAARERVRAAAPVPAVLMP